MNCNTCCENFFFVNSVEIVDGQLVLTFNREPTITDKARVCFRIRNCIKVPSGAETLPVVISVGGTNYTIYDKYGNILLGSELIKTSNNMIYCQRFVYKTFIGLVNGTYHFIIHNVPRNSSVIYCD